MISRTDRKRVICVGRLYCDLIFSGLARMPKLGEELFAKGVALHAGGGAYITAAYLAALGRPVSLVATLPQSPFDTIVRAELAQTKIDSRYCLPSPEQGEPQITVAMVHEGDRAFVTRRAGHAFSQVDRSWLEEPDVGHLHIGELTTLIDHPWLVVEAHARGYSVSLDCGWDDAAFGHADLQKQLRSIDVFLPNEAEAAQLAALGHPVPLGKIEVVKKGALGAEARSGANHFTKQARPVDVVDTTGAGDAFNAGFLNAWLSGQALETCLEAGNDCGSFAVQNIGGASGLTAISRWIAERPETAVVSAL